MQILTVSQLSSNLEKLSSLLNGFSDLYDFLDSLKDVTLIDETGGIVYYDRQLAIEIYHLFYLLDRMTVVTGEFKNHISK